jgi:hypothetical protein
MGMSAPEPQGPGLLKPVVDIVEEVLNKTGGLLPGK